MVSKVNLASRSVTVEWYERGETKGKEVEMDMLQQLNPELFNNSEQPQIIQQQQQPPQPTNLQRVSQFNTIFCLLFKKICYTCTYLHEAYLNAVNSINI